MKYAETQSIQVREAEEISSAELGGVQRRTASAGRSDDLVLRRCDWGIGRLTRPASQEARGNTQNSPSRRRWLSA